MDFSSSIVREDYERPVPTLPVPTVVMPVQQFSIPVARRELLASMPQKNLVLTTFTRRWRVGLLFLRWTLAYTIRQLPKTAVVPSKFRLDVIFPMLNKGRPHHHVSITSIYVKSWKRFWKRPFSHFSAKHRQFHPQNMTSLSVRSAGSLGSGDALDGRYHIPWFWLIPSVFVMSACNGSKHTLLGGSREYTSMENSRAIRRRRGAPQDSLSPTLFVNDLPDALEALKLLFAGDV